MTKSTFRAACPQDLEAIRDFLARAFGTRRNAPLLTPAAMNWKYWSERGDWTGPRAYLLERNGAITAFAGLWPLTFGDVRGVHMIDWASAKDAPGAGLALVQKLAAMFDFILAIGGSDMTQTVLPAFGFTECARLWEGARPLRPLRQILTHQRRGWKLAPRLVRNAWWAMRPAEGSGGYKFIEVKPDQLNARTNLRGAPRSPTFFEYLAQCPIAPFRFYSLINKDGVRGCFVLSLVRGQARIAGLWLNGHDAVWREAYVVAQRAAKEIRGANEVIAIGTGAETGAAASAAGFHVVDGPPVYLLNKKGKLNLATDFQFQLSDDDHAFLDTGLADYRT